MVVVASKAYLERNGRPRKPADLAAHNCLGFCFARHAKGWPFVDAAGGTTTITPKGNTLVSDGEAMRQLALAGLGVARLAMFHVGSDIEAKRLIPLLSSHSTHEKEAVHAVFLGQDGQMAARVRAFLDYLVERVHLS